MHEANPMRRNRVFKSLHKPLTYLGVDRTVFYFVCVAAVGIFNLFESLLAGLVVFSADSFLADGSRTQTPPCFAFSPKASASSCATTPRSNKSRWSRCARCCGSITSFGPGRNRER